MKRKIGINGFGRIGRNAARILVSRPDVELVAINSSSESASHAYLLSHDSVYGAAPNQVAHDKDALYIDGNRIPVYTYKHPTQIPWGDTGCECVLECSGAFTTQSDASGHCTGSVKRVVVSAPGKDEMPTYVMGVNHEMYQQEAVISNSSCTTNCVATVLQGIDTAFHVRRGMMTTVHAATDSQNLLDNSHKKEIRSGRSVLGNLIPSSSGSARDVSKLFPHLSGKLPCRAIRVPTATVSLVELVVEVETPTTVKELLSQFEQSAQTSLRGILSVASEELVSSDYIQNPHSAIVDPFLCDVIDGNLLHVTAWYDNEWGYANRLIDMALHVLKDA